MRKKLEAANSCRVRDETLKNELIRNNRVYTKIRVKETVLPYHHRQLRENEFKFEITHKSWRYVQFKYVLNHPVMTRCIINAPEKTDILTMK